MAKRKYSMPVRDFEELVSMGADIVDYFTNSVWAGEVLADSLKTYAGEYHRLVEEGKVREENLYRYKPLKGDLT